MKKMLRLTSTAAAALLLSSVFVASVSAKESVFGGKVERPSKYLDQANKNHEEINKKYTLTDKLIAELKKEIASYEKKIHNLNKAIVTAKEVFKSADAYYTERTKFLNKDANTLEEVKKAEAKLAKLEKKLADLEAKSPKNSKGEAFTGVEGLNLKAQIREAKKDLESKKEYREARISLYTKARDDRKAAKKALEGLQTELAGLEKMKKDNQELIKKLEEDKIAKPERKGLFIKYNLSTEETEKELNKVQARKEAEKEGKAMSKKPAASTASKTSKTSSTTEAMPQTGANVNSYYYLSAIFMLGTMAAIYAKKFAQSNI